jgi:nucleotidyltransferase/DNA polymerase involved in DNA repair
MPAIAYLTETGLRSFCRRAELAQCTPCNSVGAENTFPADLLTYETAREALREIVDKVWRYCEGAGIRGRTVTLKVKFANFQQITRSRTGPDADRDAKRTRTARLPGAPATRSAYRPTGSCRIGLDTF